MAAQTGRLREVFVAAGARDRLPAEVCSAGVPVTEVAPRTLAGLAATVTPAGVVGVATMLARPLHEVLATLGRSTRPPLVAVLVGVSDPGNAGTIVRTADAAGADAVIFTAGAVDPHNDKVVRASAGSLFHLALAEVADPLELVGLLRRAGLRVLAADAHAADLLPWGEPAEALGGPTAWLFGNEAHGLPAPVSARADAAVRVPVYGRAESLNVATAAALCLYASARAQRQSGAPRAAGGDAREVESR